MPHSTQTPGPPGGARVVIASTSVSQGTSVDRTGPQLVAWLRGRGFECPAPVVVPDGPRVGETLRELLSTEGCAPRVIVTSGGTGVTPDDVTPEQTAPLLDRELPGIMHALWTTGAQHTPLAALSRGVAGIAGFTFIVNLPGSPGGIEDGMSVLDPLIDHLLAQIDGVKDHGEH